jgi:hypothetical protein
MLIQLGDMESASSHAPGRAAGGTVQRPFGGIAACLFW